LNNTDTGEMIQELKIGNSDIRFKTGKLAKQSNGAILVESGGNGILITATMSDKFQENLDFFPLIVDVEERMYAAGKIPGGFFRREGKATDKAILNARLTDRPIRPIFDKNLRNEVPV
jgi:polyribonucleotide nucleotidyltransferase